jgi:hypothetical protein
MFPYQQSFLSILCLFLPSQRLSARTKMVRAVVGEVVGMSPYERRMLDMLKTGGTSAEKRMYKFAKRRVSYSAALSSSASCGVYCRRFPRKIL